MGWAVTVQGYAIASAIIGNLLAMNDCAHCGAQLGDDWKYCIRCGSPIALASMPTPASTAVPFRLEIPGAIRPEALPLSPRRKSRILPPALILLGVVTVALTGYLLTTD
jgi:hypothetical protein